MGAALWLQLILQVVCPDLTRAGEAAAPYTSEFERSPQVSFYDRSRYQQIGAEEQERFRKRVPLPEGGGEQVLVATSAGPIGSRTTIVPLLGGAGAHLQLLLAAAVGLAATLVLGLLAPRAAAVFLTHLNPWVPAEAAAAAFSARARAQEEDLSKFLVTFRLGPPATALAEVFTGGAAASGGSRQKTSETEPGVGHDPVTEYLHRAPERLRAVRRLLQEIGGASDTAARQRMLDALCGRIRTLKGEAGVPELLPAWQIAGALEGLLKQLIDKVNNVTDSTLRTVGGGVDLLADLSKPGVRADICTEPPFRLLAVDDDRISRHALAFALKRGLNQPDLAENGEAALVLARQRPYDVVLLDVQMPGMDGFELCSRIHETTLNRNTPIVFVTWQSDFKARAHSVLCGGNDLIGKPFLTFEISVKALTLALRARLLQGRPAGHGERSEVAGESTSTPRDRADAAGLYPVPRLTGLTLVDKACAPGGTVMGDSRPSGMRAQDLVNAFVARAAEVLGRVRDLIQRAGQASETDARQEIFGDLYCSITSLAPPADWAQLGSAGRLTTALANLLRKLLEHPENTTPTTFQTLAAAVELLGDLCAPGSSAWLASRPPIHLLVVDDDPLARRALVGGLQLVFDQPDSAVDGQAALAQATEKSYDVIFMDVQMPGMDGFTACRRVHETASNPRTPVVFVTNDVGAETRQAAFQSGGSDFITKPFLCSELTLKALTFAVRGQLRKHASVEQEAAGERA